MAVQVNVTPSVGLDKVTVVVVSPLVMNWLSSENSTRGEGLTVIEKVSDGPSQLIPLLVYVGVTTTVEVIESVVEFVELKLTISPVPLAAKPVLVLSFVQVNTVVPSVFVVVNSIASVDSPLHNT